MNQKFIQNQPNNNVSLLGRTAVVVVNKNGDIKYKNIGKFNTIEDVFMFYIAFAINQGTVYPINSYGTGNANDGIAYFSQTATTAALGTLMSSAAVSAANNIPYVIYSGSRTISHNGSIRRFQIGANWSLSPGAWNEYHIARQTANIAVSSGDTISATWTVSMSTT